LKDQNSNLLQTKFYKPPLTSDYIQRRELIDRLNFGVKAPLILISAPSGYGKSTLVTGWLKATKLKHAWISLSEYDNHLLTFLEYLAVAINTSETGILSEIQTLLHTPEQPAVDIITTKIINALIKLPNDFYLVIEDYHFIHNPEIHNFFNQLLRFPPPKFHLVVTSRIDPPFSIQYLRSKNLVTEIRTADLVFSVKETERFLNLTLGKRVDQQLNKNINEVTEGWITGIRLISLKIKIPAFKNKIFRIPATASPVRELLDEIFDSLSDTTKEYILKSSILVNFNASICDFICTSDTPYGNNFIRELKASNFLLTSLDERAGWYRYHNLFHDYLKNKFEEHYDSEENKRTHIKAALWLEKNEFPKGSIIHYNKAGEYQKAIDIFEYYRHQLMNEANWHDMIQVFNFFEKGLIPVTIELQLAKAWINVYEGRPFEMFNQLQSIQDLINDIKSNNQKKRRFLAEFNCLLPYKTYNIEQNYPSVIKQCDYALENLEPYQKYVRGYAWIFKLGAMQIVGNYHEAKSLVLETIDQDPRSILNTHLYFVLNYLQWMEADMEALAETSELLYEIGENNENLEAYANGNHFYGLSKYMTNEIEDANTYLLNSYRHRFHTIGIINFMNAIALSFTYAVSQDFKRAFQIMQNTKKEFRQKSNYYFNAMLEAAIAEIYLQQNKIDKAFKRLGGVKDLPLIPFSNFFVPQFTFVKVLIYSNIHNNLAEADRQLNRLLDFTKKANNRMFYMKFLTLKALYHNEIDQQNQSFTIINDLLPGVKSENMGRVFLDAGQKMKKVLIELQIYQGNDPFLEKIINLFPESGDDIMFTKRELDVIPLLNLTNKEIAERLFIAEKTVKRHSNSIFKKLRVKNRREALKKAEALNLL